MNESKICPLLAMSTPPIKPPAECLGDRCAWWSGEGCAVTALADNINSVGSDIQDQTVDLDEALRILASEVSRL